MSFGVLQSYLLVAERAGLGSRSRGRGIVRILYGLRQVPRLQPGGRFHRQKKHAFIHPPTTTLCCMYIRMYIRFACSGRCSRGRSGAGTSCHASSTWGLGCLGGPAFFFVGITPGPAAGQEPGGYSAASHSRPRGGSKDITAVGGGAETVIRYCTFYVGGRPRKLIGLGLVVLGS